MKADFPFIPQAASIALSALIRALYEMDCVAVVRRVYANSNMPKLGVLTPHIKVTSSIYLPLSHDLVNDAVTL